LFPVLPRLTGFRGQFRCPPEFGLLFDELQAEQFKLEEAARGLESQFLKTSAELEKLARLGEQFVKQVEKLIGLATGNGCDNSVFFGAIHLIEQAAGFLAGCEIETTAMLERLRSYNGQIEKLLGVQGELRQAMLPLNIVRTLFKMESAPLGLEVQQLFGSLTQEIELLHGQMREVFETKFNQLEDTHRTIGSVMGKLEKQAVSLRQVTTIRKAQIEASLNTLKREMRNNEDRDVRLDRLSHGLKREVEQVVVGLQFQDIVNQKLQHVLAALPLIAARGAELQGGANSAVANEALQFVRQSCRLEAGQLQLAQTEMAQSETTVRRGIQQVLAHLTEVDSQCLSLAEFKLLTTSFDGIVQVLVETIEEVRTLISTTVANAEEVYELLRPLGSLATDLTAVIRNMSRQIHLIGLNAQVKAAQVVRNHRGEGLEMLAARTSDISTETNLISGRAAAQLDALASGLAQSVKAFEQLQVRGQAQHLELDQKGRRDEEQLHAIRDGALVTLREIGDSLGNITQQAGVALAAVEFARFHQVTLPALRAPLDALAGAADQCLEQRCPNQIETNVVDGFQREYTMASERHVFAGVMAGQAAVVVTAGPEAELFNDPLPAGAGDAAGPVEPVLDGRPAMAAPADPKHDLGANVELF
jgi:hypothetical protein